MSNNLDYNILIFYRDGFRVIIEKKARDPLRKKILRKKSKERMRTNVNVKKGKKGKKKREILERIIEGNYGRMSTMYDEVLKLATRCFSFPSI